MFLTAENVVHYLIGRGLLSASAVMDGDVLVVPSQRRNRNFRVQRRSPELSLFVKQVATLIPETATGMRREHEVYSLAKSGELAPDVAKLMLDLLDYDPRRHVLVLRFLPLAESLNTFHARERSFPPELGALQGAALRSFHQNGRRILTASSRLSHLPGTIPWVFQIPHEAEKVMPSMK